MNEYLDPSDENLSSEEHDIEKALRPLTFSDFSGQEQVLENLQIFVKAAVERDEALDHTLFHGPPGLGKTTLAHILANELGVGIKVTSGPVLDKPGDLAGLLTNLKDRDVLFIDEIHRLSPIVEEYLYSAMEDYKIDIMIEWNLNTLELEPTQLFPTYVFHGSCIVTPKTIKLAIFNMCIKRVFSVPTVWFHGIMMRIEQKCGFCCIKRFISCPNVILIAIVWDFEPLKPSFQKQGRWVFFR